MSTDYQNSQGLILAMAKILSSSWAEKHVYPLPNRAQAEQDQFVVRPGMTIAASSVAWRSAVFDGLDHEIVISVTLAETGAEASDHIALLTTQILSQIEEVEISGQVLVDISFLEVRSADIDGLNLGHHELRFSALTLIDAREQTPRQSASGSGRSPIGNGYSSRLNAR